jgi:hypothetical protein
MESRRKRNLRGNLDSLRDNPTPSSPSTFLALMVALKVGLMVALLQKYKNIGGLLQNYVCSFSCSNSSSVSASILADRHSDRASRSVLPIVDDAATVRQEVADTAAAAAARPHRRFGGMAHANRVPYWHTTHTTLDP